MSQSVDAMRFRAIDAAFRAGDLDALRASVDDPGVIPNGRMPDGIRSCLVYAIYHSPIAFIRTLLEVGADPNQPADDGFPPLIAAITCARDVPGATRRTDIDDMVRLLLDFGADPNQRGINDCTPLHLGAAGNDALVVQILLDGGADPELRTRIDDCETPLDVARKAGASHIAAMLERKGQPVRERMRSGLMLLVDMPGTGELVRRQHVYRIRLRLWLSTREPVRWADPWGPAGIARLEHDGTTLVTEVRIDRRSLINGLFYGVDGMRVGGTRRLEIAPHLAYGDRGVPGVIPPNAGLTTEVTILAEVERPRLQDPQNPI